MCSVDFECIKKLRKEIIELENEIWLSKTPLSKEDLEYINFKIMVLENSIELEYLGIKPMGIDGM